MEPEGITSHRRLHADGAFTAGELTDSTPDPEDARCPSCTNLPFRAYA